MEEQLLNIGGAAAKLGFDDSDGTTEFLNRTKYKSKIDQVIEFYGIPYGYKNDIKQFVRYHIQERHRPIVQSHFFLVFKEMAYNTDDLDYGKLQMDYDNMHKDEGAGMDLKVNYDLFKEKESSQRHMVGQQEGVGQFQDFMTMMMKEMKELKANQTKLLNSNNPTNDGETTNTAGESENGESSEPSKEEGGGGVIDPGVRTDIGGSDGEPTTHGADSGDAARDELNELARQDGVVGEDDPDDTRV